MNVALSMKFIRSNKDNKIRITIKNYRIQSKYRKIRTRKNSEFGHFCTGESSIDFIHKENNQRNKCEMERLVEINA